MKMDSTALRAENGSPELPIVDFSSLSLTIDDSFVSQENIQELGNRLIREFSTTGFLYLVKTGIDDKMLERVFAESLKFFQLPAERKQDFKYRQETSGEIWGWTAMGEEKFDEDNPYPDIKEAFDMTISVEGPKCFPAELPDFQSSMKELYEQSGRLCHRLLRCLSVGLQLEDDLFLSRCHTMTQDDLKRRREEGRFLSQNNEKYTLLLRSLYYPKISPGTTEIGQKRLSAHTDFGTITLLYQDSTGGLEVMTKDGQWVHARPIKDSILVNVGDLLQRWTSDRLISTPHRVNISPHITEARQSFAYFVQPDDHQVIRCLDGSEKYEPVESGEYLRKRLAETYQ